MIVTDYNKIKPTHFKNDAINKPVSLKNFIFILLIILSMIAWAGSWISAKIISGLTTPEVLAFWRFFITFISLIPVLLFRKESLKITIKTFLLIIAGSVLLVLYNEFFFTGLVNGYAGAGGVLVTSLNPVFTFIIAAVLFKNKVRIKDFIGLFSGFIAGIFLLELWKTDFNQILMSGNLLFLGAAVLWALLTITSQKAQQDISSFVYSFYLYGVSSFLDFFLAYPKGVFKVFNLSSVFWINILYLSLIATTFATTVYFFCSRILGAHKASSFIFLVPINAVILSFLILKEIPRIPTLIGGFFAIVAVYLINILKDNKKTSLSNDKNSSGS